MIKTTCSHTLTFLGLCAWPLSAHSPRQKATCQIGLYSKVVTYFFLYRCVALSTITPSWRKQKTTTSWEQQQCSHIDTGISLLPPSPSHRATFKPKNAIPHPTFSIRVGPCIDMYVCSSWHYIGTREINCPSPVAEYYHGDTHCSSCLLPAVPFHISYLMKICQRFFFFPPSHMPTATRRLGQLKQTESYPSDTFELAR